MALATAVFYWIFDVDEDARRIWFWRHSGLMATAFLCFIIGGVVSEFIQSLLPYKTFDFGDVVANLLGSGLGLFISFYAERYYRRRREISRLYKPLYDDVSDPEDEETGLMNSTLFSPPRTPATLPPGKPQATSSAGAPLRFKNVWDDRMDVFGVGEDEDDEDDADNSRRKV